ncbi:MAG: ATP synthase F1 subunit delta [Sedimentisphaeraceae bacterium JB056]
MAAENLKTEVIAETYASVVFELAIEEDKCQQMFEELSDLADLLEQEKDFTSILCSPFVQLSEKIALVDKVLDGKADKLAIGLLVSMLRRDRLRYLKDTTRVYEKLLDEHNGIKRIDVTVASQMTDEQKTELEKKLSDAVNAQVKIIYSIDPEILGGIIIRHGGEYVDNSLRRILSDAKSRIKNKIKA